MAEIMQTDVREGMPAPGFVAQTETGETVKLSDFAGKKNVILYFYPKDDTPGCTKEACSFRDDFDKFAQKDTVIFGVSLDSAESHRGFKQKYQLPFPLLVDTGQLISRAYGTLGDKGYNNRMTFLIGKDGRIRKIFPQVKVDGHSAELLNAIG